MPPNDIQRYYNDNIQQYQTPEQVRASHILLNTGGKDEAAVRKQAEEMLAQIKGGADFAELAKKFSEDEGARSKAETSTTSRAAGWCRSSRRRRSRWRPDRSATW